MKNVTTGLGLCVLGVGIASYPVLDHLVPRANAGAPSGSSVIVAATAAQVEPTIVWYGTSSYVWDDRIYNIDYDRQFTVFTRAWSDGKIEMMRVQHRSCGETLCTGDWQVVSTPAQGLNFRSDINFDSRVDGADLGALLADWGDAPRQDIPPSDCPLNLINP